MPRDVDAFSAKVRQITSRSRKRGLRLVWDEQPTAVGCYVLMPRSR